MPDLKTKPPPEGLLEIIIEPADFPEELWKSLTDLFQESLFGVNTFLTSLERFIGLFCNVLAAHCNSFLGNNC